MKPVLVSYADLSGGAARATYRLHEALRAHGVDSKLVVRERLAEDPSVHEHPEHGARWARTLVSRGSRLASQLQRTSNPVLHSPNVVPTRMARHLQGDVVNLHWVGDGTMSIEDIGRIPVPTVLTLHDMWAFCGAEHYAQNTPTVRWIEGYTRHNRPDGSRGLDVDRLIWERKRRAWPAMRVVAPSQWLADCARRSALMADWPVQVVPNPLDVRVFRPRPRDESKQALGVPPEVRVVLFGALWADRDSRKGYDLLVTALRELSPPGDAVAVVFGQDAPAKMPDVGMPMRWVGRINGEHALASLYSAADVMVVPSRQENLPQTATEAQACGVPVVAFDTSGLPDVVAHEETGYLAEPFATASLARGIAWVLEDPDRHQRLGKAARERAEARWAPEVVVPKYVQVYEDAIGGRYA